MTIAQSIRTVSAALAVASCLAGPGLANAQQLDLSGEWSTIYHEDGPARGAGPELGDYSGIPINDAGRLKAESWDASALSLRERQCIPHISSYALRGPATIRLWKTNDPLSGQATAYQMLGSYGRPRTIWLDDRPHPSRYAPHSWTGFSTGRWEGGQFVVTTTHLKVGWLQRNGVAHTDQVVMTERFIRHQNQMLIVTILEDPAYLEEPFVRTTNFQLTLTGQPNEWGSCGPAGDEVAGHPKGYVPHYLPGENPYLAPSRKALSMTAEGAGGGAFTVYPEYSRGGARTPTVPAPITPPRMTGPGRPEITDSRTTGSTDRSETTGSRRAGAADRPEAAGAVPPVEILPVQGNVFLLASAAGNVTVQIGEQGVLVVDAGPGDMTDALLAALKKVSDKPVRYVLNTHAHADHVGGNDGIARSGQRIRTSAGASGMTPVGAAIYAHENVLIAMSAPTGQQSPTPVAAWPSETYFNDLREVYFNNEAIQLMHAPAAHTDGDSLIFFRKSDVISAGDVFITTGYPAIDTKRGGSVTGVIDALNKIIEVAVPKDWQEGGTMIIPGHGRIGDEADVVEYRDMVTIVFERVQEMVKKGMTLAQVKAARPTRDYDGRYGATTGPWTTDMFVEAVFQDVSRRAPGSR